MMRRSPAQLIASLESASRGPIAPAVAEFEGILSEIAALDDPNCIRPLVLLLRDDESWDELMFGIVHIFEKFEDEMYVKDLIRTLPELWRRSPRWATILHMRILNSESARLAYADRLRSADLKERAAARAILSRVRDFRPEFADRVSAVLDAE